MATREWIGRRAFDDGVDRWEVNDARPAPGLRTLISRYSDYSETTVSFSARQELATTSGVLIYALGEPLEIVGADGHAILLEAGRGVLPAELPTAPPSRGIVAHRPVFTCSCRSPRSRRCSRRQSPNSLIA